jgi:hypothetical protein
MALVHTSVHETVSKNTKIEAVRMSQFELINEIGIVHSNLGSRGGLLKHWVHTKVDILRYVVTHDFFTLLLHIHSTSHRRQVVHLVSVDAGGIA